MPLLSSHKRRWQKFEAAFLKNDPPANNSEFEIRQILYPDGSSGEAIFRTAESDAIAQSHIIRKTPHMKLAFGGNGFGWYVNHVTAEIAANGQIIHDVPVTSSLQGDGNDASLQIGIDASKGFLSETFKAAGIIGWIVNILAAASLMAAALNLQLSAFVEKIFAYYRKIFHDPLFAVADWLHMPRFDPFYIDLFLVCLLGFSSYQRALLRLHAPRLRYLRVSIYGLPVVVVAAAAVAFLFYRKGIQVGSWPLPLVIVIAFAGMGTAYTVLSLLIRPNGPEPRIYDEVRLGTAFFLGSLLASGVVLILGSFG